MRISNVRALSLLPREFKDQPYIEIKAGERIIICSDKKTFRAKYGDQIRIVEFSLLKNIVNGGFLAINNLSPNGSSKSIVRIGKTEMSQAVGDKIPDNDSIEESYEGACYSRDIALDGKLLSWRKSIPNPGKK
jgi:hypothetical protein